MAWHGWHVGDKMVVKAEGGAGEAHVSGVAAWHGVAGMAGMAGGRAAKSSRLCLEGRKQKEELYQPPLITPSIVLL